MSAVGRFGRFCGLWIPAFGVSTAFALTLSVSGLAQPGDLPKSDTPLPEGVSSTIDSPILSIWDGEAAPSLDELGSLAARMGQILEGASDRVDQLLAEKQPAAAAVAIRHELTLSRQWNQHLETILLQVADARRKLGAREREAAAEIVELTKAAEVARQELIGLKEALHVEDTEPSADISPRIPERRDDRSSLHKEAAHPRAANAIDLTRQLTGTSADIADANETLTNMHAAQDAAAGDIEKVRTKIIDALRMLAPHVRVRSLDDVPSEHKPADKFETESRLSSEEITAWAASIASKMHDEGYDDPVVAGLTPVSAPAVEVMHMDGEALRNAAVRAAPERDAVQIAIVPAGDFVLVTGKVVDRNWYRIETVDGRHGYISAHLIRRQPVRVKPIKSS